MERDEYIMLFIFISFIITLLSIYTLHHEVKKEIHDDTNISEFSSEDKKTCIIIYLISFIPFINLIMLFLELRFLLIADNNIFEYIFDKIYGGK